MPGPAFHLSVLDLTIQALAAGSASDKAKAALMKTHMPYARIGSLGPDFLRYRPVATAALDTLVAQPDVSQLSAADLKTLGQQVQPNPEMATFGYLYRVLVPRLNDLTTLDALLQKLADAASAEDVDQLKALQGAVSTIKPSIDALGGLQTELKAIYQVGAFAIVAGKPLIEGTQPNVAAAWRPFEFLRWKRTGVFARALLAEADAANDDALRAYAYGAMSHVAAAVVGEPFVNDIVGGPYRTHWWRNRWVRNYIDAWTYGRYATPGTMAGDTPTPAYADWRSVCGPNLPAAGSASGTDLQDEVKVDAGIAGADAATAVQSGMLPPTPGFDKIGNAIIAAAAQAFGAGGGGPAINMPKGLGDLAALQGAYVGTLSVLWFMTGTGTLCPRDPGAPPAGSETPPPWYGSAGSTPPPTSGGGGGGGSSTADTVSAILAIILTVLAVITGNVIIGVGALVAAIAAIADSGGDPVDWQSLRGTIYWLQMSMFQLEDGLHKALVAGGLAYPFSRELGTPPSGIFGWQPVTDQSSPPQVLTRSGRKQAYPLGLDETLVNGKVAPDLSFNMVPQAQVEEPSTRATFAVGVYASHVVDEVGLLNGGIMTDDGSFPTRDVDFGGAVANAAQVISASADKLANYNLDGDRGSGWKTWKPKPGTTLVDSTPVNAVEES